jgi:hypothetical protein
MPVSTAAAAYHIAPGNHHHFRFIITPISRTKASWHIVVVKTFFKHAHRKTQKLKNWTAGAEQQEEATDDIFYDECVRFLFYFMRHSTMHQGLAHREGLLRYGYPQHCRVIANIVRSVPH